MLEDGLDRATFDEEREHHPATATAVARIWQRRDREPPELFASLIQTPNTSKGVVRRKWAAALFSTCCLLEQGMNEGVRTHEGDCETQRLGGCFNENAVDDGPVAANGK